MSHGEIREDNVYAVWMREKNQFYAITGIKLLTGGLQAGEFICAPPTTLNVKTASWRLASEITASSKELESCIHAIERVPSAGRGKPAQFVPIRFIANNKLTKIDKLMIAFDGHVLADILKREIVNSKIIHGDGFLTLRVKISVLADEVKKIVGKINSLLTVSIPPELILNRHCPECGYQRHCREKADEKDDLSLLGGMGKKERKKLNSKGIFTVTQLSYTFRPRRRPKRQRDKKEKYHQSLKALAIREKKIHIVGSPELKIEGTPIYLDVEGLPDRDFYYLIGLRIRQGDEVIQHSLWADRPEDEARIWRVLLEILATIEKPVLIHYGSYETTFIKAMCSRYGASFEPTLSSKLTSEVLETSEVYNQNSNHQTSEVLKTSEVLSGTNVSSISTKTTDTSAEKSFPATAVNLLSVIYGNVYFPVASNGLKAVAGYCGFKWSEALASGLQSIVWREQWETSGNLSEKQKLIQYNAEDCEALESVTQKVSTLQTPQTEGEVTSDEKTVDISTHKRENVYGFKKNTFLIPEFEEINQAAYWDYQRERVYVKSKIGVKRKNIKVKSSRELPHPNKIILCPPPKSCHYCGSIKLGTSQNVSRIMIDLKFSPYSIKRWVTQYNYGVFLCRECGKSFHSDHGQASRSKHGDDLIAFTVYQFIELFLPIGAIERSYNKLFGLNLGDHSIHRFKTYAANSYASTYDTLIHTICNGRLIHADETKISLKDRSCYVWVLTSMEAVVYVFTETRESDYIKILLKNFQGVLVSDFYAGYESIDCPQQKCLIHLIRDFNNELYKHPYDNELKQVADSFAKLLRPMIETVDHYGLKKYHLNKHVSSVEEYYKKLSYTELKSETAKTFKKRLEKNEKVLFTFLQYDDVPWNNNNAEHAVKSFVMLRHIIKGVTTEKGLKDYLILLSICQTCKYRGLDFLYFLRSGEKDIDVFAASQKNRRKNTTAKQTSEVLKTSEVYNQNGGGLTSEVSKNLGGLVIPAT